MPCVDNQPISSMQQSGGWDIKGSTSVFVFFILIVFPFEVDGDEVAKEMVEVDLKGPF